MQNDWNCMLGYQCVGTAAFYHTTKAVYAVQATCTHSSCQLQYGYPTRTHTPVWANWTSQA